MVVFMSRFTSDAAPKSQAVRDGSPKNSRVHATVAEAFVS